MPFSLLSLLSFTHPPGLSSGLASSGKPACLKTLVWVMCSPGALGLISILGHIAICHNCLLIHPTSPSASETVEGKDSALDNFFPSTASTVPDTQETPSTGALYTQPHDLQYGYYSWENLTQTATGN